MAEVKTIFVAMDNADKARISRYMSNVGAVGTGFELIVPLGADAKRTYFARVNARNYYEELAANMPRRINKARIRRLIRDADEHLTKSLNSGLAVWFSRARKHLLEPAIANITVIEPGNKKRVVPIRIERPAVGEIQTVTANIPFTAPGIKITKRVTWKEKRQEEPKKEPPKVAPGEPEKRQPDGVAGGSERKPKRAEPEPVAPTGSIVKPSEGKTKEITGDDSDLGRTGGAKPAVPGERRVSTSEEKKHAFTIADWQIEYTHSGTSHTFYLATKKTGTSTGKKDNIDVTAHINDKQRKEHNIQLLVRRINRVAFANEYKSLRRQFAERFSRLMFSAVFAAEYHGAGTRGINEGINARKRLASQLLQAVDQVKGKIDRELQKPKAHR